MRSATLTFLLLLLAMPVTAQPISNESGGDVNLRAGPSVEFPRIGVVRPGEVLDLGRCDLQGRWCLVSSDARFGWVNTDVLRPPRVDSLLSGPEITVTPLPETGLPGTGIAPQPTVPPGTGFEPSAIPGARPPTLLSTRDPMVNVTPGLVNLRDGPGLEYEVIDQLEPGQGGRIDLCNASERWCRIVRPDGRRGWIKTTLLGLERITPR